VTFGGLNQLLLRPSMYCTGAAANSSSVMLSMLAKEMLT